MKLAIIMRGLPGSGKSFWVEQTLNRCRYSWGIEPQNYIYCSTDEYFFQNGKYCFDKRKLSEYHQYNLAKFIQALAAQKSLVVCDNTNLAQWEYLCYQTAATALNYQVRQVLVGDPLCHKHQILCAKRNQHGLSLSQIKTLAQHFDLF